MAWGWAAAALLCACAPKGPPPPPVAMHPGTVGVAVTLTYKAPLSFSEQPAREVFFARVSGLNGSNCLPREHRFDEARHTVSMAGALAGGMGAIGAAEGEDGTLKEGGFAEGYDPTCLYDEAGLPVWEPTLYRASRIVNGTAFLLNVPPGRYTAVAAQIPNGNATTTLLLGSDTIDRTEVAVPEETAAYMGSFRLKYGGASKDETREMYRERILGDEPSVASRMAGAILVGLLSGNTSQQIDSSTIAQTDRAAPPDEARKRLRAAVTRGLPGSEWAGAFVPELGVAGTAPP
jgi:hypothetical protein